MAIRSDEDLEQAAVGLVEDVTGRLLQADASVLSGSRFRTFAGPDVVAVVVTGVGRINRAAVERIYGACAVLKVPNCLVISLAEFVGEAVDFASKADVALFRYLYDGTAEPVNNAAADLLVARSAVSPDPDMQALDRLCCDRCELGWLEWREELLDEAGELDLTKAAEFPVEPERRVYVIPGYEGQYEETTCGECRDSGYWVHCCDRCGTDLGYAVPHVEVNRMARDRDEGYEYGYTDILDRLSDMEIDVRVCVPCAVESGDLADEEEEFRAILTSRHEGLVPVSNEVRRHNKERESERRREAAEQVAERERAARAEKVLQDELAARTRAEARKQEQRSEALRLLGEREGMRPARVAYELTGAGVNLDTIYNEVRKGKTLKRILKDATSD